MRNGSRSLLGLWCLALASLAACTIFAPRPDSSRFFTLTPIGGAESASGALRDRTLGIGPITLPNYLDRPELVTRVGPNEVRNATFDYWAGSLQKQFASTLAQNLQTLLGPSAIVTSPWYPGSPPDVSVEVDVVEFERGPDGEARLVARWRLSKAGKDAHAAEARLTRPTTEDPASTVAALSELLAQFSRDIAAAVK